MIVSLTQVWELLGVGVLAGLLGGLLGIGGGIVMIPAMVIFLGDERYGPNSFHVYKLAAITTSIVLSTLAAVRHARARAVVYRMLPSILPLALVGVAVGVGVSRTFVGAYTDILRQIFGGFLELVVVAFAYQEWHRVQGRQHLQNACPMPSRRLLIGAVVGFPAGVIAGLLGVGGGAWAVPAQRLALGVRLQNAIANSSAMIVAVSIATAAGLTWLIETLPPTAGGVTVSPLESYWLALWLCPGAFAGGWVGAGLTHRLPVRYVRYAFQLVLVVTGVRLMFG